MSFTKRDYEAVARIIQTQRTRADMMRTMDGNARDNAHNAAGAAYASEEIQRNLSRHFAATNPAFDAERFARACEPGGGK
jgi:hypothetical protein